ncbi:MAG: ATP-dependent zinc metalloprotease FtsH [Anaerolineales bacterium]|nr:ATP-dependent zinc metalloprotease FtsH [Anaerolineales bacterium]
MNDDSSQNPELATGLPRLPNFVRWLVLLGLLCWTLWAIWPQGTAAVELPYSAFLGQVEDANVAAVTVIGNQIQGSFNRPVTWPATDTTDNNDQPRAYTDFTTMFPDSLGDSNLLPLLEANQIEINVLAEPTPWFAILLTDGLPIILLLGYFIFMTRRVSQQQSTIFGVGRSQAKTHTPDEAPAVTFADVAGADEAKAELQQIVEFLQRPEAFLQLGARIPRGVLLVGLPGTGKTLLARAVAGEAGVPFFSLSASEFVEMFVGVGASRVRDLFDQARQTAPAIVFIDELDAVGRRRGAGLGAVNDEREQTLNQLLVEMDGFDARAGVILLAATNRPDVLDPALLRPGRFDRQVVVNLPDQPGREGILRLHASKIPLAEDVDLSRLAQITVGMSGADLANLCNEAALAAATNKQALVHMHDFDRALDKITLGGERPLLLNEQDRRVVAYHEAGHALVAWLLPAADTVHKVTIIPRGRSLGVTEQRPQADQYNLSNRYLLARLAVLLGGRTAEEIAIGDITTGAENDLVEATRLARRMVTRWGMSEVGLATFDLDEAQPFLGYELAQGRPYADATAARIDAAIQDLLTEQHELVHDLLAAHQEQLDALAAMLLSQETVSEAGLAQLLGERSDEQIDFQLEELVPG